MTNQIPLIGGSVMHALKLFPVLMKVSYQVMSSCYFECNSGIVSQMGIIGAKIALYA